MFFFCHLNLITELRCSAKYLHVTLLIFLVGIFISNFHYASFRYSYYLLYLFISGVTLLPELKEWFKVTNCWRNKLLKRLPKDYLKNVFLSCWINIDLLKRISSFHYWLIPICKVVLFVIAPAATLFPMSSSLYRYFHFHSWRKIYNKFFTFFLYYLEYFYFCFDWCSGGGIIRKDHFNY